MPNLFDSNEIDAAPLSDDFARVQHALIFAGYINLDIERQREASGEVIIATEKTLTTDPTLPILVDLEGGREEVERLLRRRALTVQMIRRFGLA